MSPESNQSGIKIYFINLDRSTARRERIEDGLNQFGLVAERVSAVDGSKLTEDELFEHYDSRRNSGEYFSPLKKSEIACFLSHRKVLSRFLDQADAELALILEDDAEFVCDPKPLLSSLAAALHKTNVPVIVKLYSVRPVVADAVATLANGFELTYPSLPPLVTVAQVFNKAAAQKFLDATASFCLPIDVAIQQWWKFPIQVLTVQPNVVTHHADQVGGSTITPGKRLGLTAKIIREVARPIYRFRVFLTSRVYAFKKIPFQV
jgi:GR25 family glycosyltransferase involved in LPS biosynthesis